MSHRALGKQWSFLPPKGYYNQPHPESPRPEGAKAPQEHLADLGEERSGEVSLNSEQGSHHLKLHHPGDGTSHMIWHGHERSGDTFPGEIVSIKSAQKGDAQAMHDTAREMATDNPHIAFPKHSPIRTEQGESWVKKEQRRHNEAVWGAPEKGTHEYENVWSKLTTDKFYSMMEHAA